MRKRFASSVAKRLFFCVLYIASVGIAFTQEDSTDTKQLPIQDESSVIGIRLLKSKLENKSAVNISLRSIQEQPLISVQQYLKGNSPATYIMESTGEPGSMQQTFVRGISSPFLSKKDIFSQQAVIYLNGIPLIEENPFAFDIQKYDFNRIGPATNLLSAISADNIESIEVIKDPVMLANLGPYAANGVIWIITKNATGNTKKLNINAYSGFAFKERVSTVNAAYEKNFRMPFYNKYGTLTDLANMPSYIRDSANSDYYGPARWNDEYYRNGILYNLDATLSGGTDRANFRFYTGITKNSGNTDKTALNRYTGSFFINVKPLTWFTVSSMLNYTRLERKRNLNIRDRLAEQRYIPSLVNPLTPTVDLYKSYLNEFGKSIDDNVNNLIQGYVAINTHFKKLNYEGRIGFDYNDAGRDVFWPTTLLEGNNFLSNYFGFNQRVVFSNELNYKFSFKNNHTLKLSGGQGYMSDIYKYDYAMAYNSPNDYIKINSVTYLNNILVQVNSTIIPYFYTAKMQSSLASFYGNAAYSIGDKITVTGLFRRDGSSNMQPDARWFNSYGAGINWNVLEHNDKAISRLLLKASWSRLGKLLNDDRFNKGPLFVPDLGWTNEPTLGTYVGIPGLTRPYTSGWVGYGIPWSYVDQLNLGFQLSLWKNKVNIDVDIYNKDDKQSLLPVPVSLEWGYTGAYKQGMDVNNKGVEVAIGARIAEMTKKSSFGWNFKAFFNVNQNKLKALPDGLDELVLGQTKLKTGERIDAFWLWKNNGIYNSTAEVPVNPATGKRLSFQGVELQAGDPKWVDINGDFIINNADRTLLGNYIPKITGGFNNTLQYKALTLDFQLYFAAGRKILNQYAASRLDFINTESNNDINSVKEITFWEKRMDLTQYPLYNPWSPVVPYRLQQDLFLEDGSFLKLRSVTLGYTFSTAKASSFLKTSGIRNRVVYLSANNLFTATKFKGNDPELVNYNGIHTGYGLPIPRSVIIGIRLDL